MSKKPKATNYDYLGGRLDRGRQHTQATELNQLTYNHYFDYLFNIAATRFKWVGLPESVSPRYLNIALIEKGSAGIFFDAELYGKYLVTSISPSGPVNLYGDPKDYRAYGFDGFNRIVNNREIIPIWLNTLRRPIIGSIQMFARRLADMDRTVDVNVAQQKTPVLVYTTQNGRQTIINAMAQRYNNEIVIVANNAFQDGIDEPMGSIPTTAPYVADEIQITKARVWNEIMTFFGIENANQDKKERLVRDEVGANDGQIEHARLMNLECLREACDLMDKKWGLKVDVFENKDLLSRNIETLGDIEKSAELGSGEG